MPIPQLIIFLTNFHYFVEFFLRKKKLEKNVFFWVGEIIILLLSKKKF